MTNKQRILAMFKEFENPDKQQGLKNILSMMSDDIIWNTQGPADIIPYAGSHKGKDGVAKMFATQAQVLQPAKFMDNPQFIGGDNESTQVFYMAMECVKLQKSANSEYQTGFAMIFNFNDDGLITSAASLFDTYAVAKAFEA